jgi:GTP pyrophosphokinase
LRKLGLTKVAHAEVARLFGHEKLDDFLAAVGRSEIPSEAIAARLLEKEDESKSTGSEPLRQGAASSAVAIGPGEATGVTMRGADGVFTRVARCCRPLPGESVVGYITRGRGVTLHRADCHNIAAHRAREPERFIRVAWQQIDRQTYPVELHILAYDRAGLVRDLSDVIAQRGVNMRAISAGPSQDSSTALVTAVVQIASHRELTGLIDKLGTVENVIEVRRPTG